MPNIQSIKDFFLILIIQKKRAAVEKYSSPSENPKEIKSAPNLHIEGITSEYIRVLHVLFHLHLRAYSPWNWPHKSKYGNIWHGVLKPAKKFFWKYLKSFLTNRNHNWGQLTRNVSLKCWNSHYYLNFFRIPNILAK